MTYFTFSRALHLMKYSGAKVRRANNEWYLYIENNNIYSSNTERDRNKNGGKLLTILATSDILANDWELYDA